ncbi:chaperone protein EcpD [Phytobacter palmae]|nr:chaperone protein EcpD [Phytobacter palmae]
MFTSFKLSLPILGVLAIAPLSMVAYGSVVINGTRVIYQGDKKEVTVSLTNNNKTPVLIQNWLDYGKNTSAKENEAIPFIVTPPINRVDPGKGQTLRIRYTGLPALPQDRESVLWLNVLEIPSSKKTSEGDEQQSKLNIAFRTKIKFFYRPAALTGSPVKAAAELQWHKTKNEVIAKNHSKFYISLVDISWLANGKKSEQSGTMISPGATAKFSVRNAEQVSQIRYTVIDDYGGIREFSSKL